MVQEYQSVTASFAWQFVWALVGALLGIVLKPIWDLLASRRGEFTGEWTQTIPAFEGEPEKIAIVKIRHSGDRLYGRTERTVPRLEFVQRWKVDARIKRGLVFGIYWPEDSSKLPGSYGTLQFKIQHENKFEGFYVRVRSNEGQGLNEFRENLKTIPIRWERHPESRIEKPRR
jgi:hypothetical protein